MEGASLQLSLFNGISCHEFDDHLCLLGVWRICGGPALDALAGASGLCRLQWVLVAECGLDLF